MVCIRFEFSGYVTVGVSCYLLKYIGGVSPRATIRLGQITQDMIDSKAGQSATAECPPSLLAAETMFKRAFVQDRELCRYVVWRLTVGTAR